MRPQAMMGEGYVAARRPPHPFEPDCQTIVPSPARGEGTGGDSTARGSAEAKAALILRSGPKGRVSKDGAASCFERRAHDECPPSPFETLPRLSPRSAGVAPQDEGGFRPVRCAPSGSKAITNCNHALRQILSRGR